MKAITHIKSHITPMVIDDIDTDIIIPAQYLTQTSQTGFGSNAFSRLKAEPDFVLNQSLFQNSRILLAGDNFGCGSSREHAIWAIKELGYQAVIAPSFADIFSNNAKKNGLLLIQMDAAQCQQWAATATKKDHTCYINIEAQVVTYQSASHHFDIDPFFKWCLTQGQDELAYLQNQQTEIKAWEQTQQTLFLEAKGASA
ncbi:3-isopropylmalate dehydratase small subunit [Marinicella rhabdoformis]|uniref:3-isopropylmalate dehydratase small subunit n=1 Tax=Marinicella rhabdoformis TaxID=2580566 RepID=UPI0012AED9EF|nr:3-isopropylmalate dehydratase small subunit [Marinicella rhabdoformis]